MARAPGPGLEVDSRPRASRQAVAPPEHLTRGGISETFFTLPPKPHPTDEQGIGKSPRHQWPWHQWYQSLVEKRAKQGAHWPQYRQVPSRPELSHAQVTSRYLLYYEQAPRHVWPGGMSGSQQVIERPSAESVPLTSIAPRLGGLL